ncbi:14573_t:CDS:2, partial [Dentiscutata erythropus]
IEMAEERQPTPEHIKEKYKTLPPTKEEKRGFCCLNRQIQLAQLKPPPPVFEILLTEEDPESNKLFIFKIITYNQIFAFISIGEVYTYKIQRQHYYQHGSLMPKKLKEKEPKPKFAQIYFYDSDNFDSQLNRRHKIMNKNKPLNKDILSELQFE